MKEKAYLPPRRWRPTAWRGNGCWLLPRLQRTTAGNVLAVLALPGGGSVPVRYQRLAACLNLPLALACPHCWRALARAIR